LCDNSFANIELLNTNVDKTHVKKCKFDSGIFTNVTFAWSHLSKTDFMDIKLKDCCFKWTNCSKVIFKNCEFINTIFKTSDLRKVEFISCTFDRYSYNFAISCKAKIDMIESNKII
jgi:uncharacterized protein YjbI with pentapeptide repeats